MSERADDVVMMTVGLGLMKNDPERPWPSEWAYSVGCGAGKAEAVAMLREMADAIEADMAFGFMMQQLAECAAGVGDLEPVPGAVVGPDGKVFGIVRSDA